jgi:deoxyribose-phosphate aldolase
MNAGDLAALIDHTLLKADSTPAHIDTLCREALEWNFGAVCINPAWVALADRLLQRSRVRVCTVVGFPLGATTTDVKAYEAQRAIAEGACEIDMVMNIGALKARELDAARADMAAVIECCRVGGALCKVIIETGLLTDDEKASASAMAEAAGADFVKTSTGFGPGGATVDDVALIRRTVGSGMGIKAAGRIRDLAGVLELLAAGATRIGTSGGVPILREAGGDRLRPA